MKLGLVIYGSLDTLSGGYMYDRKLVEYLRAQGDTVEIISLPWRNYAAHLTDNFSFKLPTNLDILIQDELNHPSLIGANDGKHPYPIISLVHHLRCSELRPKWQNGLYRMVEKKYLQSVDGFHSIASANYDEYLEFFSIKVRSGPLTSRLQHLKEGDSILVSRKPVGTLVIDDLLPGQRLYLLGSGTGLAPFLSIIQDPDTYDRFDQVVLVHGVRYVSELAYAYFIAHELPDQRIPGRDGPREADLLPHRDARTLPPCKDG